MSNPIMVADPFAPSSDVATAQQQIQRAVEEATALAVLPFEIEKVQVTNDHIAMQRHIWGQREDEKYPVEPPNSGA